MHLVWAPLGPAPLREFGESLDRHPAGLEADVTVVMNGFASRDAAGPWLELVEQRGWQALWTSGPHQDLGAYAEAAAQLEDRPVCLMNSYARPLAADWLAALVAAFEAPGVAAAAATGSWESLGSAMRIADRQAAAASWRDRLGARYDWVRLRLAFPAFPNPHLRTNGLVCERSLLLDAVRRPPQTKEDAYRVESGRRGVSRLARRAGEVVVVGRDGRAHAPDDWPASRTFRSAEQENLLIADNRTVEWDRAAPDERDALARRVWGRRIASGA